MYVHLHGRTEEYPFTTLLWHGHVHVAKDAWEPSTRGSCGGPGAARAGGGPTAAPLLLPYTLVQLPYSVNPRPEYGGPDSPFCRKVGWGWQPAGPARQPTSPKYSLYLM